jgi:hypothetical protein
VGFGVTIFGTGVPFLYSGPQLLGLVLVSFGLTLLAVGGVVAIVELARKKRPTNPSPPADGGDTFHGPVGSVGQSGGVTHQTINNPPEADTGPVAFQFGPGPGVENNVIEFATVRGFPTIARFLSGRGNIIRHLDADAPLSSPNAPRPPAQNRKARRAAERKRKKGR